MLANHSYSAVYQLSQLWVDFIFFNGKNPLTALLLKDHHLAKWETYYLEAKGQ